MAEVFVYKTVVLVIEEDLEFVTEAPLPAIYEINREEECFVVIIYKKEFEKVYHYCVCLDDINING